MPAIAFAAEVLPARRLERQTRDHDDPVIALLAVERDVLVAESPQALQREAVVGTLGLLQAQHVRPRRLDELGDEVDAQPHGVDVPGGDGESHATLVPTVADPPAHFQTYQNADARDRPRHQT